MTPGRHFYPMARAEKVVLGVLLGFAAGSFLPIARSVEVAGMALFGWWMAALMLLAPLATLWTFRRRRPRS